MSVFPNKHKWIFAGITSLTALTYMQVITCSSIDVSKEKKYVAFSMSVKAQNDLKQYLERHGLKPIHGSLVVIKVLNNDKEDQYVYEPLFGERAAFRLKGIVTTDTGISMVGSFHHKHRFIICVTHISTYI